MSSDFAMEDGNGMTTISRQPGAFWLGVYHGRKKDGIGFSTNDPFEERLWKLGRRMGRKGEDVESLSEEVILALARKDRHDEIRGVWIIGLVLCVAIFWLFVR